MAYTARLTLGMKIKLILKISKLFWRYRKTGTSCYLFLRCGYLKETLRECAFAPLCPNAHRLKPAALQGGLRPSFVGRPVDEPLDSASGASRSHKKWSPQVITQGIEGLDTGMGIAGLVIERLSVNTRVSALGWKKTPCFWTSRINTEFLYASSFVTPYGK